MGKKFLQFLKKYRLCILLSSIIIIGMFLATVYADLYKSGGYIRFNSQAWYLIFGLPIFSLIYGCLSYLKMKKVLIPNSILYVIVCIYFLITNSIIYKASAWVIIFIVSVYPVIFSLIGVGITVFIRRLIKVIQQSGNGF